MKPAIFAFFLLTFVCFAEANPAQKPLEQVEDMILTPEQKELYNQFKNGRVRRAAVVNKFLWPKGKVYYSLHSSLNKAARENVSKAIKHYEEKTCLKFINIKDANPKPKHYAEFKWGGGCRANVGYKLGTKGKQMISIGLVTPPKGKPYPCELGSIIHEIGHSIGFFHEHARPDRDEYIEVVDGNMLQVDLIKRQFEKVNKIFWDSRDHKYDYDSIMHYGPLQGSKNGKPVMKAKEKGRTFGQRDGLSDGDVAQIKDMYKCNANDESELSDYVPSPGEEEEENGRQEKTKGPQPGEIED